MKQYRPIATYSTAEDIKNMFPCDTIKPDMADIIFKQYKEGVGKPHRLIDDDEEAWLTEDDLKDAVENGLFFFTTDKRNGVYFTRGVMSNGIPYGYYIDIYELVPNYEEEPYITDGELAALSRKREKMDARIKKAIIREFKARFKNPGEGLDFYSNASQDVEGLGVTLGIIREMVLGDDGEIYVWHIQEYEDAYEGFEDNCYNCVNWPQLLLNVRKGIQNKWFIEE